MPTTHVTRPDTYAVNTLYARGAKLLRVHADKTPAERAGWPDRQLSLDDLLPHVESGGLVGLEPYSIDLTVLDVDGGDPDKLAHNFTPAAYCRSGRRDRAHLYYRSDREHAQQDWRAPLFGCSGQIRSRRGGYVVLWEPARLADDLEIGRTGAAMFEDVLQALDLRPSTQRAAQSPPAAQDTEHHDTPPSPAHHRHAWMKTKIIAARVDGKDGPELRQYAKFLHEGLVQPPDPRVPHHLDIREALALADWAASMRWDREAQAERGRRSGEARRALTAERDAEIIQLLASGLSERQTASKAGVTRRVVQRVKDRL